MKLTIIWSLILLVITMAVLPSALALGAATPDSATLRGQAADPNFSKLNAPPPWTFCTVGDITSEKVVKTLRENTHCALIVLLGDYYDQESKFVGGFKMPGVPLLAACGNHDDCDNVARNDNIRGGDRSLNYGFRWKDTGFLILNTEDPISGQKAKAELLFKRWQNDSTVNHVVVAQHKNAITTPDAHHPETEIKGFRTFLTEMQHKYPKFQVLLQGHNHNWMACKPSDPKLLVITDGTGGRKAYPLGTQFDDGCDKRTAVSGNKQYDGFTVISLSDKIEYEHINVGR